MESQSVVQLTLTGNGVRLVENNEAQVAIPGLLRETSQLLRIIKDDRPGSAGVPRLPAWKRINSISCSGSEQCSWLGRTRAGGDACAPRTIVFDYFQRFFTVAVHSNDGLIIRTAIKTSDASIKASDSSSL